MGRWVDPDIALRGATDTIAVFILPDYQDLICLLPSPYAVTPSVHRPVSFYLADREFAFEVTT